MTSDQTPSQPLCAATGEEVARAVRAEARRLQSRRKLIDAFSHDVRTPLTVISQYLDLLADELSNADPDEQRQIVRVMRDRATDLNHSFNNLLDALKFDVGTLSTSRRICHAADVTDSVRSILERRASALSRTLEFDFQPNLAPIFCDADQISRVLVNLAIDALKGSSSQDVIAVWAKPNDVQTGVRIGLTVHRSSDPSCSVGCHSGHLAGASNTFFGPFGSTARVMRSILRRNLASRVSHSSASETCVSIDLPGTSPEEIVARYLKLKRVRSQRTTDVTFVEVTPAQPANRAVANEVLGLISLVVRLRDLVFPLSAESWLVAFCRQKAAYHDFKERLQTTWETINHKRSRSPLPPLRVQLLGNWRPNDDVESVLDKLKSAEIACDVR